MTNDNKKLFLVQIKEDDWRTSDDKFGNWTIIRRGMCKELTPALEEQIITKVVDELRTRPFLDISRDEIKDIVLVTLAEVRDLE